VTAPTNYLPQRCPPICRCHRRACPAGAMFFNQQRTPIVPRHRPACRAERCLATNLARRGVRARASTGAQTALRREKPELAARKRSSMRRIVEFVKCKILNAKCKTRILAAVHPSLFILHFAFCIQYFAFRHRAFARLWKARLRRARLGEATLRRARINTPREVCPTDRLRWACAGSCPSAA
jgi:hypothetical protein